MEGWIAVSVQIVLKNMERLYPALVFKASSNGCKIDDLDKIYSELDSSENIFVISKRFSKYGEEIKEFTGIIKKSDIVSIVYIENEEINLDEILTLSEAAKKWGLADGSTIRKAIEREKFNSTEIKQAGAVWITTYKAMTRVFGEIKNKTNKINEKEFSELLARIKLLDTRRGALWMYKATVGETEYACAVEKTIEEELLKKYKQLRDKLERLLNTAHREVIEGNSIVFYKLVRGKEKIIKIINNEEEFKYFINTLDEKNIMTPITKKEIYEYLFKE